MPLERLSIRAQVRHKAAMARLAGKRWRPKRCPTPAQPAALEDQYAVSLMLLAKRFAQNIKKHTDPFLQALAKEQGLRQDAAKLKPHNWKSNPHALIDAIKSTMPSMDTSKQVQDLVAEHAAQINRFNHKQMTKMLGKALSVDVYFEDAGLAELGEAFVAENVGLIQSIGEDMLDQVQSAVMDAVREGARWETLAADISKRFEVSQSRAELIARDQTLKLGADLTKSRMQEAGLNRYIWRTVGDGKVREGHRDLEGQICSYDDPPDTGDGETNNPGEDYQCRCWAEPVMDDLLEEEDAA